jgi:hypothetical protein
MRRVRLPLLLPIALLTLASCGGESTGPDPADVRDFIEALATSGGIDAVFHTGDPPAGGSGPVITINSGTSAMIAGGSAIRVVSSAQAFTRIILAVEGIDGYWEITLPVAVTTEELVLTLGQVIPLATFTLEYGAGTNAGLGFFTENVEVLAAGTGDVQVSVTWDTSADVDLHVVEPSSEEIYYGHKLSNTGGELDLDSNAACAGDNVRNENITWPNTPPSGTYTVRVNYWDDCGAVATNWVVTVRRKNQAPLTFSGQFTGTGTGGGLGAGSLVTTFTY